MVDRIDDNQLYPFQEEIWQILESKNFEDIWELTAYMGA